MIERLGYSANDLRIINKIDEIIGNFNLHLQGHPHSYGEHKHLNAEKGERRPDGESEKDYYPNARHYEIGANKKNVEKGCVADCDDPYCPNCRPDAEKGEKCILCNGVGRITDGLSQISDCYRTCPQCHGTGKPSAVVSGFDIMDMILEHIPTASYKERLKLAHAIKERIGDD